MNGNVNEKAFSTHGSILKCTRKSYCLVKFDSPHGSLTVSILFPFISSIYMFYINFSAIYQNLGAVCFISSVFRDSLITMVT